ncbi:MAG: iron-containing alcohol dehydrogenase [Clostridiaceae bacterium]|jgi:alcohol dehydrogenase class IV|nr:iron-containing alcohol dehydrogenase [Clostridiaceae bacterium]
MIKQYYMPTQIIMGEDCVQSSNKVFSEMGKKALIVTGKNSARLNGSLDDIIKVLSSNGQEWALFDKIMSNPTIECVYEGAAFAKTENVDFIIAIGGGSPMDAAKAINLLACQDIPEDKLFNGQYSEEILSMILVPTTAGTGSEVTPYAVLTNNRAQTKTSIASHILFPKVAILDAKYMENLPKEITVNTAIDALSHSIEGMLSLRANPITDSIALDSIRRISRCFESLKTGELTREQRFELLYASTLAGMVIANTKTTAVHSMGYSLTYFHDIDHGRANGLLLGEFLKYVEKSCPDRVSEILSAMGLSTVNEFITLLDELLGERENLTDEQIEKYVSITAKSSNIKNSLVTPDTEDLVQIYKSSMNK